MNHINIDFPELNTELSDATDSPVPPARPEPPEVGKLHTPDDLRPLHRQLLDQAATLPARSAAAIVGRSDADHWSDAAKKVDLLWEVWRRRMHATEAHEPMRQAANKAVHALVEGLRGHDWRDVHRWFDLAAGWIDDVKMQADVEPYRPSFAPAPARPTRRGLRGLLFARPR